MSGPYSGKTPFTGTKATNAAHADNADEATLANVATQSNFSLNPIEVAAPNTLTIPSGYSCVIVGPFSVLGSLVVAGRLQVL